LAQNRTSTVISATALVTAAIALMKSSQVYAAGEVTLDEATRNLIIAIAAASGESLETVKAILDKMTGGSIPSLITANILYPPNSLGIDVLRLIIVAANTPYQGPHLQIRNGYVAAIKADPRNAVGGFVNIGQDATVNINSAWPLIPNEGLTLNIQNADQIWYSGLAGDALILIIERERTSY
jgi:hypothetical protein